MSLQRKNNRIQVFSRLNKSTGFYVWVVATVERGSINVIASSSSWHAAYQAALRIGSGQTGDLLNWLNPQDTVDWVLQ